LHPTRIKRSVSSIPVILEFMRYWLLKSALKYGAFLLTSMLSQLSLLSRSLNARIDSISLNYPIMP
jgi:hypothetical protein